MAKEEIHDTFEGEIPVDLGKKKPVWIKYVGLAALAGVLGTAAYVLNTQENREDMMNATKSQVETFMTEKLGAPSVGEGNQPSPDDEISLSLSDTGSEPVPTSDIAIEIEPTEESIDVALNQPPIEPVATTETYAPEPAPVFDEDPITITPPQNVMNTAAVGTNFAESREFTDLKATVNTIQQNQQERINIMKSGIDLQTVSLNRLQELTKSLNDLKSELAQLSKQAKPAPVAERRQTPEPAKQSKPAPAKPQTVKKTSSANKPNLVLLGIDRWAGEEFAQLQHNDEIHLLAVHESLSGWRVANISQNTVTVINDKGESFEITN
jgi:hypothetical protein